MGHKNIRIKFEVDDRRYQAVGFLRKSDGDYVFGTKMLRRTATKNGGAIGKEDETFLKRRFNKLPNELRRYWLVTSFRNPNHPRKISCFHWSDYHRNWSQGWYHIGGWWRDYCLVLRRCP